MSDSLRPHLCLNFSLSPSLSRVSVGESEREQERVKRVRNGRAWTVGIAPIISSSASSIETQAGVVCIQWSIVVV